MAGDSGPQSHRARWGRLGGHAEAGRQALVDTLEASGVDLGRLDHDVIAQLAVLLDPVAVATVVSLIERTADAPPEARLPASS